MIWLDYVFIGIVFVSTLIGVWRGLIREALSLVTWIVAIVLTLKFGPVAAHRLAALIESPTLRSAAGHALIFFSVLVIGALITWLFSLVVKSTGLTSVDRMLGGGFGFARGVLILLLTVLLTQNSVVRQEPAWRQSALVPELLPLARQLQRLYLEASLPWKS